jgi:predicted nucleotidyltransferase
MATIYRAPEFYFNDQRIKIFLAGSIEMGNAENWQQQIEEEFSDIDVCILNPRRLSWDPTWKQEIENPLFLEQVEWELDSLEFADIIVMYFDPNTKAPISLMELGAHKNSGKLIVFCPDGFYRKGNVDIFCKKYNIKTVQSFESLIDETKKAIDERQRN